LEAGLLGVQVIEYADSSHTRADKWSKVVPSASL